MMTVKDLIDKLSLADPNAVCVIVDTDAGVVYPLILGVQKEADMRDGLEWGPVEYGCDAVISGDLILEFYND